MDDPRDEPRRGPGGPAFEPTFHEPDPQDAEGRAGADDEAPSLAELMRVATRERTDDTRRRERLALIGRYLEDLRRLEPFERSATSDLARVARLPIWRPTPYEERFLPGLRLAGIGDVQAVALQNTADLHMHTEWSDGDDLDAVLERAVAERLDVIAITDHDEIAGALEARRRVHERRLRVAVVPGIEVSSRDGHVGGLFLTRAVPPNLSAEETVARIHAAGGLAVAHHPFAPAFIERVLGVKLGCGELITRVPFDAIECTNAVPGYGTRYNIAAIDALRRSQVRVGVTGSSDAHRASLVGKGKTYFAGNLGVTSLRTSLELGLTLGAEGYWKLSEKLQYRLTLARGILRNLFRRRGSVN